ncbi:NACHT domain-containing protein [Noviluteimonas gilva]|uniref:NACHT C-terminal Alpha/Beta 2 domain-containing protein n=1 Tax=Noviluteimonas gilva TaxID=2682097 RepID=A0A7C9HP17_9GAMM|nr:hypothetical protein [Lysobacter gilvus]MUV15510.1 hypothetical protein [Lysobacter gilvus]
MPLAENDLASLRRRDGWPAHPVEIPFTVRNENGTHDFTPKEWALKLEAWDELTVVAGPGTGKSTSLLQLAAAIVEAREAVAVFISLADWATYPGTPLLHSILLHASFTNQTNSAELQLLAETGDLVLILDGWNELDATSRQRARVNIHELRREFPLLRVVVSTRQQTQAPPLSGANANLGLLSHHYRLEIARAHSGDAGVARLMEAEATPGIREVIRIPLFLSAVLAGPAGQPLPATKEELLAIFVREQEARSTRKSEVLASTTHGYHREILQSLAAEGMRLESTALPEHAARAIVSAVLREQHARGLIGHPAHPGTVLDVLVAEHLLVRPDASAQAVSFQHQQFQEWFASFHVEDLMRRTHSGDSSAAIELRSDVLNWRRWDEAVLFASERLCAVGEEKVVATAAKLALDLDPVLAGNIIHACPKSWQLLRQLVTELIQKHHVAGQPDLALALVNTIAQPDFWEEVRALTGSSDTDLQSTALSAGDRFPPSLLGPDPTAWINELPDQVQVNLLIELIQRGGVSGVQLATAIAVQTSRQAALDAVAEYLYFYRHDSELVRLLESRDDAISRLIWHIDDDSFATPMLSKRLREERVYAIETASPAARLRVLLDNSFPVENREEQLHKALVDPGLDLSTHVVGSFVMVEDPEVALRAWLARLEAGLEVPYGTDRVAVENNFIVDSDAVRDILLSGPSSPRSSFAAAAAGPNIVRVLFEQYVRGGRREHPKIYDTLRAAPLASIGAALSDHCEETNLDRIGYVVELIRSEDSGEWRNRRLDNDSRASLVRYLKNSARVAITQQSRELAYEVALAIGGLADADLSDALLDLLRFDIARRQEERAQGDRGDRTMRDRSRWDFSRQYVEALSSIGGDKVVGAMLDLLAGPDFTVEAARVLVGMTDKRNLVESQFWTPASFIAANRREPTEGSARNSVTSTRIIQAVASHLAENEVELSARLMCEALRISGDDHSALVGELLSKELPASVRHRLLVYFAASGGAISATDILDQVRHFADLARGGKGTFRNGPIHDWVALFPHSDSPLLALSALGEFPVEGRAPHEQGPLLKSIESATNPDNDRLLVELAKIDPRFLRSYEWWRAAVARSNAWIAMSLIDSFADSTFDPSYLEGHLGNMTPRVVAFCLDDAMVRSRVYDLIRNLSDGPLLHMLSSAVAMAPDDDGVLLIVERISQGQRLHGQLHIAIRKLAIAEEPDEHWQGSFQLLANPVVSLRSRLFELTGRSVSTDLAAAATYALQVIERLRDDYGHAEAERRNPNPDLDNPWPLWSK